VKDIELNDLIVVSEALRETTGIDFSNYAFSSYKRRITRYMELNKVRRIELLTEKVRSDKNYADQLVWQVTVNVTEMFRDPSFWSVLRDKVLPQLKDKDTLNIWIAACSTGKEVFTLAILLYESGLLEKTRILATDLNRKVLEMAAEGECSFKCMDTYGSNYQKFGGKGKLGDYFKILGNTAHFDKNLLAYTEFKYHNLAQNNVTEHYDLILCRNVLIYFNSELQDRVIYKFSKALLPDSFLGLGSKESIGWCKAARFFVEENIEEKIYKRKAE